MKRLTSAALVTMALWSAAAHAVQQKMTAVPATVYLGTTAPGLRAIWTPASIARIGPGEHPVGQLQLTNDSDASQIYVIGSDEEEYFNYNQHAVFRTKESKRTHGGGKLLVQLKNTTGVSMIGVMAGSEDGSSITIKDRPNTATIGPHETVTLQGVSLTDGVTSGVYEGVFFIYSEAQ